MQFIFNILANNHIGPIFTLMSNVCQNVLHVFALVALHALHARRVQSALLPQRVRRARLTQLARRVKRVSLVRQRHRQPTP